MTELPRLELTANPDKNNDFIIFPNDKGKKIHNKKSRKSQTKVTKKHRKTRKNNRRGLFSIF